MVQGVAPGGERRGDVRHLHLCSNARILGFQPPEDLGGHPFFFGGVARMIFLQFVPVLPVSMHQHLNDRLAGWRKLGAVIEEAHRESGDRHVADHHGFFQKEKIQRGFAGEFPRHPETQRDHRRQQLPRREPLPDGLVHIPPTQQAKNCAATVTRADDHLCAMFATIDQTHPHGAIIFHENFLHGGTVFHLAAQTRVTLRHAGDEVRAASCQQPQLFVRQQPEDQQHEPHGHFWQKKILQHAAHFPVLDRAGVLLHRLVELRPEIAQHPAHAPE